MRKAWVGVGGLVLSVSLLVLAATGAGSVATGATPPTRAQAAAGSAFTPPTPIKHVVIIYQENHTFDDVLGSVCAADKRKHKCDGTIAPVTMADGITAPNATQPDVIPVIDHDPHAQHLGYRNAWDDIRGCQTPPYWCVSHVDPSNMQNLTRLANRFTVSDATFAAGKSNSFGAHVTLGAGTFDEFHGHGPVDSKTGAKPRFGWGCPSRKDALWGPHGDVSFQPTCIPNREGKGPYRASKVPYTPTIMERMEQAGLTWHIYEGDSETQPTLGIWSVCTYFAWCWRERWNTAFNSSREDFVASAKAGTLPNLSILIPSGGDGVSQHNFTSMRMGDDYIGQIVGAAMRGPEWDSTAIFITYDDCGCFYDHVKPPNGRMGMRNPMVIISPYAKAGGTDSHVAIQPYSMLAFTEHTFGLAPLTDAVTHAYDYRHSFNYRQRPLSGPRMTYAPIPAAEQARLARLLPYVMHDET